MEKKWREKFAFAESAKLEQIARRLSRCVGCLTEDEARTELSCCIQYILALWYSTLFWLFILVTGYVWIDCPFLESCDMPLSHRQCSVCMDNLHYMKQNKA